MTKAWRLGLLLVLVACNRSGLPAAPGPDLGEPASAGCVAGAGLQRGAPWPVMGGCATQQRRSRFGGPRSLRIAWTFHPSDSFISSSPAVAADGTVYVGSADGAIYALDGTTGAKRWAWQTGFEVVSSPAIGVDGTVYVGSMDGKLYALDGASGIPRWTFLAGAPITSSPTVTRDGAVLFEAQYSAFFSLDAATGAQRWSMAYGTTGAESIALAPDGTAFLGEWEQGAALALEPATGRMVWRLDTGVGVLFTPGLGDDGRLVLPSTAGVQSVDASSARLVWSASVSEQAAMISSPAIGVDGTVYYFSDDLMVRAIDGASGRERWRFATGPGVWSRLSPSPTLAANGTLYIGALDGNFYALDAGTGDELWAHPTGDPISSSAAIGANGFVYVGSSDGTFYAFGP